MRIQALILVLAGCSNGIGEISFSGSDDDGGFIDPRLEGGTAVDPGDDEPGVDVPGDETPPATGCGLESFLVGDALQGSWRHFLGTVTLNRTSADRWDWRWSGCEAERIFEDGELVCERVWNLTGPIVDSFPGDPTYVYSLDFKADPQSTCPDTSDQSWMYGFDVDNERLELFYRGPESSDWVFWTDSEYRESPDGTVVKFDYTTEFFGVESATASQGNGAL